MPQEFHVLRCFKCETFQVIVSASSNQFILQTFINVSVLLKSQVHIVKKVNKWECKMCGVKQSIIQVYGNGSSKDCRMHVQKLNELRFNDENILQNNNTVCNSNKDCIGDEFVTKQSENRCVSSGNNDFVVGEQNKWNKYIKNSHNMESSPNVSSEKRKIHWEEPANKKICLNSVRDDFNIDFSIQNNSQGTIPFVNLNNVFLAEYVDETDKIVFNDFENSHQSRMNCSDDDNSSFQLATCYKSDRVSKMKIDVPKDKNIFNMDDETDLDQIFDF